MTDYLAFLKGYRDTGDHEIQEFLADCARGFFVTERRDIFSNDKRLCPSRFGKGLPSRVLTQIPIPYILAIYAGVTEHFKDRVHSIETFTMFPQLILEKLANLGIKKHEKAFKSLWNTCEYSNIETLQNIRIQNGEIIQLKANLSYDPRILKVIESHTIDRLGITLFMIQFNQKLN